MMMMMMTPQRLDYPIKNLTQLLLFVGDLIVLFNMLIQIEVAEVNPWLV